jgi:hypothetical protein
MMQSEKAKLISCFVNDYCIPTTLFKTISKLRTIFFICTQTELCKLWSYFFQTTPFKRKKDSMIPCALSSLSLCLSVCLSLSLSLCVCVCVCLCVWSHQLSSCMNAKYVRIICLSINPNMYVHALTNICRFAFATTGYY